MPNQVPNELRKYPVDVHSVPQSLVATVEGYIHCGMWEQAADECVRMAQTQPANTEVLAYCGRMSFFGTTEQIQKLLAVINSHMVDHGHDHQVREIRALLLGQLRRYPESLAEFDILPDDHRRKYACIVDVLRSIVEKPGCPTAARHQDT